MGDRVLLNRLTSKKIIHIFKYPGKGSSAFEIFVLTPSRTTPELLEVDDNFRTFELNFRRVDSEDFRDIVYMKSHFNIGIAKFCSQYLSKMSFKLSMKQKYVKLCKTPKRNVLIKILF